jgi:hypothetical protein
MKGQGPQLNTNKVMSSSFAPKLPSVGPSFDDQSFKHRRAETSPVKKRTASLVM